MSVVRQEVQQGGPFQDALHIAKCAKAYKVSPDECIGEVNKGLGELE